RRQFRAYRQGRAGRSAGDRRNPRIRPGAALGNAGIGAPWRRAAFRAPAPSAGAARLTARPLVTRRCEGNRLVVASHNPGKVREIEDLIRPLGFRSISASELGLPEPAETGTTFLENAILKASAAAGAAKLPALADDS